MCFPSRRSLLTLCCLTCLALPMMVAEAWAQYGQPRNWNFGAQAAGQERIRLAVEGRILQVQGNVIQVKNKDGQEWYLRVDSRPNEVIVEGEAEKEWVQPGMFVYFTGKFDRKGQGQEPVSKVNIFTPSPENQLIPGVMETAGFGGEGRVSDYDVVGRVAGVGRDGKWTVAAGQQKIVVEIDDDADIQVNVANPALIQVGDEIKGNGYYYTVGVGILSGQLEIEAAKPFKAPEKNSRSRRNRNNKDDD